MITQKEVKNLFNYEDGKLYWIENRCNNQIKAGTRAGCIHSKGYWNIKIDYKLYKEHRLIFLYHNGYLPKILDHIDNNRMNNNIENLREATVLQNNMNRKNQKNSSSKYKGVCWDKNSKKWHVRIRIYGKSKHLGYFINEEDAARAYDDVAKEYHGKFVKLNMEKIK